MTATAVTTAEAAGWPQTDANPGPAPKQIVITYGFWIFLLSDIIMFSALFATYAVLSGQTAGGPTAHALFDLRHTAIETACLLVSSYTCGLGILSVEHDKLPGFYVSAAATFVLGAAFLGLELTEFAGMIAAGAVPSRSAFLSSFFTLVGMHGAHVTLGLLWLAFLVLQVWARGFPQYLHNRLLCFSLFWHALDIIWVAILTLVYLLGAR
jgi:cytochrome o ubiquinol oxidase subunit 3